MGTTPRIHRLPEVSIAGVDKGQGRITWDNGTFSDYVTLRFPAAALQLTDIDQPDPLVKLRTTAQLRYVKALSFGRSDPTIIVFGHLSPDQPARQLFPDLATTTDDGEVLLSANSLLTYTMRELLGRGWLRRKRGHWQVNAPNAAAAWQTRGQAVLDLLTREERLLAYRGPGRPAPDDCEFPGFPARQDLIPVGRLGFVRDLVWRKAPLVAFNTAFFLLEHDDFLSHHSALGEPYNLFVQDGVIQRPPLYRRSTLCQDQSGRWTVRPLSLTDVALRLPDGTRLVPAGSRSAGAGRPFQVNAPAEITLYTRRYGIDQHGRVLGRTPTAPGRLEITVIDRRAVGWKAGGGLELPQNGFVISLALEAIGDAAQRSLKRALAAWQPVTYEFLSQANRAIRQAIQVGPRLLQDGQISLTADSLAKEEFWMSRIDQDGELEIGVVPTDFPDDVDRTRAGRCGVGIDRDGQLVLVAISSTETGVAHVQRPEADSHGATLVELAELLQECGAVEAVNLDGGGSTQVFFMGGAATVPGNRLGLPGVFYERMVPAGGLVG